MRIGIFGTGGVGGYFGALLARAGHEVSFIARGQHLEAIQQEGLTIQSVHGDFHLDDVQAGSDPADLTEVEYIVVAVKQYHLAEALPAIAGWARGAVTVVPLLNGVTAPEILMERIPPAQVTGGLCSVISKVQAPGVISQQSQLRRIVLGELDHQRSGRLDRLVQAWSETGVESLQSEDIHRDMWTKFAFIATFGGVGSLTQSTAGEMLNVPETRAFMQGSMAEIEALGRAEGIHLAEDVVEQSMALLEGFEPSATSSMQRDVAEGRPFELEAFSGTVVDRASDHDLEVPLHRAIYALLLPALSRALAPDKPVNTS